MQKIIPKISVEVKKYNSALVLSDKKICKLLAEEITNTLPEAENKIWHGAPVWFLDGNPIVGYDKLKDCLRLLFWSGQSFDEKDLKNEGNFKASEIRYTNVSQVKVKDLKRWVKKSKAIQWDYKNIRKNKGALSLIHKG